MVNPAFTEERVVPFTVRVINGLYFLVQLPCGQSWPGMCRTDDIKILGNRAIDHVQSCPNCVPA